MTRMFLIVSFMVVNLVSTLSADTLVDVFDDSLQSQIMNISASQIEEALGDPDVARQPAINKSPTKGTKPRIRLASFRIGGKANTTPNYNHWTPGNYPMGMVGKDAFFTIKPDKNFYYFAADIVEWDTSTKSLDFSKSLTVRQADHHLEKLPKKLARPAKR